MKIVIEGTLQEVCAQIYGLAEALHVTCPGTGQPADEALGLSALLEDVPIARRARIENCLRDAGIETVKDLTERSRKDLLALPYLGKWSVGAIIKALERRRWALASEGGEVSALDLP